MRIDIKQVENVGSNKFEVLYNNELKFKADLPFITINDPFNLEKLKKIIVKDTNENIVYTTNYNYVENLKEEIIPFKFLKTHSQKFNQIVFLSLKKEIKIYYEENAIWTNRYVIEFDNKKIFIYSIEDGTLRHFPIYEEENQIGEMLKSNVIINGKDEYVVYLKKEYELFADSITCLALYLDRSEYSSSYMSNESQHVSYKYSYNNTNRYYDKDWVRNNFDDKYIKKVNEDAKKVKNNLKMETKKILTIIGVSWIILLFLSAILLIILLK